jgi:hypothetical protein
MKPILLWRLGFFTQSLACFGIWKALALLVMFWITEIIIECIDHE